MRARWSPEGEPLNVEAAIADALDWMELQRQALSRGTRPATVRAVAALARAIVALTVYGDAETQAAHPSPPVSVPPEPASVSAASPSLEVP